MKETNPIRRAFTTCLYSIVVVHLVFLFFLNPLRGQVADTSFFINEAHHWWDSSVYRYAAFLGDMPVEPIWEDAEVTEVPNGTHLIVVPILHGTSIQVSDGWQGTAAQANGGVRLVLTRFSPTQIYPLLFFVYGYSDYTATVGLEGVYSKNKPHGLDTAFTGEAFYVYPGIFPNDTMRLLYGIGLENGVVVKEFYPAELSAGEVGYRCCVQQSQIQQMTIQMDDGSTQTMNGVVITWNCSGCGYVIWVGGGPGGNGNSGYWHPNAPDIPNNGGGGSTGGGTNEGGGTSGKPKPMFFGPLCPDGSPRPLTGCTCPDGTPMPEDGDCGEVNCQLTHVHLQRRGADVYFPYTPVLPYTIHTLLYGKLTDCEQGTAEYNTIITNPPSGYSTRVIGQHAILQDVDEFPINKTWLHIVKHVAEVEMRLVLLSLEFEWTSAGELSNIHFPFKYR